MVKKIMFCLFILFIYSCSKESNIFNTNRYYINNDDLKYQVDSIKVVEVIDNRIKKDSVIGEVEDNQLIITRPLNEYLKMSLNALICKDSNQKSYLPVKVYIDDFYSARDFTFWYECIHFKYSFLFEYPYKSEIKKLRLKDSLSNCYKPDIKKQRQLIIDGIRESSRLFLSHFQEVNKTDSIIKSEYITINNPTGIDTINLTKARELNIKSGLLLSNYLNSYYTGFLLSYLRMYNKSGNKSEIGYGIAFEYFNLEKTKLNGYLWGFTAPVIYRYNLSESKNGIFLDATLSLIGGNENLSGSNPGFFIGGRIEESIGLNLFDFLSVNAGIYQQGYLGFPFTFRDLGFVLSLNITGGY